jgi:hypothetical protein
VDGEVVDIKTGMNETASLGSAQQLKRKQHEAPGMWIEIGSEVEGISLLRPHIIESAGEPKLQIGPRGSITNHGHRPWYEEGPPEGADYVR